jgi:subtilisin family serine protease
MAERRVIIEMTYSNQRREGALAAEAAEEPALDERAVPELEGFNWDESFPLVEVPGTTSLDEPEDPRDVGARFTVETAPEQATYLARGVVDDEDLDDLQDAVNASRAAVGLFSDVEVEPQAICPGDPPLGSDGHVERLLCTSRLHDCGLDGSGVLVAVVDSGINLEYLLSRGKRPSFDAARSWVPVPGLTPGHLPVGHGTMVAYDVCIAAPRCTLLDIALLRSRQTGPTVMSGFLSDAVLAYRHLLDIMLAPQRPGEGRSLVVNNSWGMFHPTWDFPVGHPGNYSDNPNHPFNRIVGALERAGADILFAAGNCGADCPDGRCQGVTTRAIYGANSHPQVLSVAGVDVDKNRVGYSAIGPGRLARLKPDVSGYTHFKGSGVFSADGGTSAASPVVAGVVAAARSRLPYSPDRPQSSPAAMRNMITKTAEDRGLVGYDFEYGWGIVNGCGLAERLCPPEPEKPEPERPRRRRCCCLVQHHHYCHCGPRIVCWEEEPAEEHHCAGRKPHGKGHGCGCRKGERQDQNQRQAEGGSAEA